MFSILATTVTISPRLYFARPTIDCPFAYPCFLSFTHFLCVCLCPALCPSLCVCVYKQQPSLCFSTWLSANFTWLQLFSVPFDYWTDFGPEPAFCPPESLWLPGGSLPASDFLLYLFQLSSDGQKRFWRCLTLHWTLTLDLDLDLLWPWLFLGLPIMWVWFMFACLQCPSWWSHGSHLTWGSHLVHSPSPPFCVHYYLPVYLLGNTFSVTPPVSVYNKSSITIFGSWLPFTSKRL